MLKTHQFVSLYSPCQIKQEDYSLYGEKLRWIKEGVDWWWTDNQNWFAYELTYDSNVVDDKFCSVSDIIYSYGFQSYSDEADAKQWGDEWAKQLEEIAP